MAVIRLTPWILTLLVSCGTTPQKPHPQDTAYERSLRGDAYQENWKNYGTLDADEGIQNETMLQQEIRDHNVLQQQISDSDGQVR